MIATFTALIATYFLSFTAAENVIHMKPIVCQKWSKVDGPKKSTTSSIKRGISRPSYGSSASSSNDNEYDNNDDEYDDDDTENSLYYLRKEIEKYSQRNDVDKYMVHAARWVANPPYEGYTAQETKYVKDMVVKLLDFSTNFIPGVSWGRDVYEVVWGKDLFTDEKLSSASLTLAAMGVMLPYVPVKKIGKKLDVVQEVLRKSLGFDKKNQPVAAQAAFVIKDAYQTKKTLEHVSDTADIAVELGAEIEKTSLRSIVEFMREIGVNDTKTRRSFVTAFLPGAEMMTLKKDLKVYRYYSEGYSYARGKWVTTSLVADPVKDLALKPGLNYEVVEWTIPEGTRVLVGRAAANEGQPGGAIQIFLDPKALQ